MQIMMCWVASYKEYRVGKYIKINKARVNNRMRKILINSFAAMESSSVFRLGLFFLTKKHFINTALKLSATFL